MSTGAYRSSGGDTGPPSTTGEAATSAPEPATNPHVKPSVEDPPEGIGEEETRARGPNVASSPELHATAFDGESVSYKAPPPALDPYIGQVISERYRVISKLGEGGMGVVYLAEHIVIEKKVALKILSDDFARKPDLVARFMQEAKAASRIGHENIVDITDFGQTAGGSVFFAMEHLDGADLAGVIAESGPMELSRAIPIVLQICRALGAAHGKGIIHRDMKPENIFIVTRDGRPDFVKILDFGIAKMSTLDEPSERLTRTGMIFGTPEYMSPEQARGDRPDHRVDIYAVGCIIYEMLTGDVPFHAETFMGVLTKHMFEAPDAMTARVPVSPEVEAVVMRALAKNRNDRYQSMRELAVALSQCGFDAPGTWNADVSGQVPATLPVSNPGLSRLDPTEVHRPDTQTEVLAVARRSLAPVYVVAALAVAALAFALWPRSHQPIPIVVPAAPTRPPVVPPKPDVVAKRYAVAIEVEPPGSGAELYDGDERMGALPGTFSLAESTTPIVLTARRKGFRDHTFKVTPDHTQTRLEVLEPLPRKAGTQTPKKPTSRPEPPPKLSAPLVPVAAQVRSDPKPEPAPAPKPKKPEHHDLMDPFSNP